MTKHLTLRNVVWYTRWSYHEYPLAYIGETGRTLATRMKDHLNIRNWLTAVGEHCPHEHHNITKDSVRLLAREDIWLKRKVREAIKIKIGQPAMNRDQGYELPPPSTMNYCCRVIVVKAVTWPRRIRHMTESSNNFQAVSIIINIVVNYTITVLLLTTLFTVLLKITLPMINNSIINTITVLLTCVTNA